MGADISMSSATKYINGHGDVVMGLTAMNDEALYKRLHFTLYGRYATTHSTHTCDAAVCTFPTFCLPVVSKLGE